MGFSNGADAGSGRWAAGPAPDGEGESGYPAEPPAGMPMPPPTHPDVRFHGTTEVPDAVEKVAGRLRDTLKRE
jgi:Mn-containing catalase